MQGVQGGRPGPPGLPRVLVTHRPGHHGRRPVLGVGQIEGVKELVRGVVDGEPVAPAARQDVDGPFQIIAGAVNGGGECVSRTGPEEKIARSGGAVKSHFGRVTRRRRDPVRALQFRIWHPR